MTKKELKKMEKSKVILSSFSNGYIGIVIKEGIYANTILHPTVEATVDDLKLKANFSSYLIQNHRYSQKIYDLWDAKDVEISNFIIDYLGYTKSEIKVLENLRKIKSGQIITYNKLAEISGFKNGARFVGNVMRKNRCPLIIPCHRVVKKGSIGNYFYGTKTKREFLKKEGVKL